MLMIIGGKRSSCVRGHLPSKVKPSDLEEVDGVIFCDCASSETVLKLIEEDAKSEITYILEHAWAVADSRQSRSRSVAAFALWCMEASKLSTVVLLTREVSHITKTLREVADLRFDFN